MTYRHTLHHHTYIVSLAGGRQNKQKGDIQTYRHTLHHYIYIIITRPRPAFRSFQRDFWASKSRFDIILGDVTDISVTICQCHANQKSNYTHNLNILLLPVGEKISWPAPNDHHSCLYCPPAPLSLYLSEPVA